MIYEIGHRIEYQYSAPVYLETHQVHLTPRSDAFQVLRQFHLSVEPAPASLTVITDTYGNPAHEIWFSGQGRELILQGYSKVETLCLNPFDFLLREDSATLPVRYSPSLEPHLMPFWGKSVRHPLVVEFAAAIAARTDYKTTAFLSELCAEIKRSIRFIRREEGFPLPASQTLEQGAGACRDLAVLFIACCRHFGLAARFTSGYAFGHSEFLERELHAWAEVYLEGAGWRGFDPSTGLAVSDSHVALASAPTAEAVTPVSGTFRSRGASARMRAQVTINRLQEARSA